MGKLQMTKCDTQRDPEPETENPILTDGQQFALQHAALGSLSVLVPSRQGVDAVGHDFVCL